MYRDKMNAKETLVSPPVANARSRNLICEVVLMLSDIITSIIAFIGANAISFFARSQPENLLIWQQQGTERGLLYAALSSLIIFWFSSFKSHYTRRKPFWDELREVVATLALFALIDATSMFLGKWQFSRLSLGLTWVFVLILIPVGRVIAKRILLRVGLWQNTSVLIGVGENAVNAYLAMQSEPLLGYRFVAAIALRDTGVPIDEVITLGNEKVRVYSLEKMGVDGFIRNFPRAHVVFAPDVSQSEEERSLMYRLAAHRSEISVVPPLRGLPLYGTEVEHFFSHEVLLLHVRNNLDRLAARILKRAFDIVFSIMGLLLLAPFFVSMYFCLQRPGGPAIFGHVRVGRFGRLFKCYKLRSMVPDSGRILQELLESDPIARAEWERDFKLKNDPRITSLGAFLRKTSLDELPQLWNVLKGEMSLVGPRPVVEKELEYYGEMVIYYKQVRPGITGLWQISGRNDVNYRDRVNLDAWYVRNWSLWYDIVILLKTVRVVLLRQGAY